MVDKEAVNAVVSRINRQRVKMRLAAIREGRREWLNRRSAEVDSFITENLLAQLEILGSSNFVDLIKLEDDDFLDPMSVVEGVQDLRGPVRKIVELCEESLDVYVKGASPIPATDSQTLAVRLKQRP